MKTKIVLHADDMGKVPELLSNLGNMVRYANTHEQDQIEVVSAGVLDIAVLQQDGFSYIKP
ncbi:hypothetical protein FC62_GL001457 [Amylolactobacillus amylotrophicus DSM 20534]|uniref:Uncharacterized protein n=3 Tax=Amylolactobacillus TaxID=2767876 RepID=A0A0R1YLS9_9LACO|nr:MULTISPECIES: hypothetical protein [Amylolactobacillus]APT18798.1 hypothetical protein LA20533_05785 [Amylolactobacillus amylophilus DSM 20533 = JCM 1125]KRK37115.1 hypothetical protein FC62_GL001457 [Amylolactobacillus amylotrophicus DSM 20534]KRM43432.1 hypothetical protein FD40_GL000017 [Amylolactobacillus amylophilus DSM 20533 = JCM 1125]GED80854.1 hypothetical protein LAM01_13270 [Amylolactobacillus amylophilus]